jgi:putative endonuclease
MKNMYVYIVTNRKNGVLYTGVTNNVERRMKEHKLKVVRGLTSRYNLTKLVYFESLDDPTAAIDREKQIKGWLRSKKISLIESMNPEWKDLTLEWD